MTAMSVSIKMLLAGSGITALVGQRIYPVFAPQNAAYPNIIIHNIFGAEEELLQGATQWPEARISVECRGGNADPADEADLVGEAVVNWLRDKDRYSIDGCLATFRKEGTDETDTPGGIIDRGIPVISRRIIDYYVRYRAA